VPPRPARRKSRRAGRGAAAETKGLADGERSPQASESEHHAPPASGGTRLAFPAPTPPAATAQASGARETHLGSKCLRRTKTLLAGLLLALALARPAAADVRIKDIADVEGVRDNQLVGYGLAVGLNGTGDRLRSAIFTRQSLVGMLERLGVNTRDNEARLDTRNVAAVMVTANLPPFARPGSRIDIAVSALGDATNLTGGTLLVTPLLGADGEVYAVAQGAVATGAISARGRRRLGHPRRADRRAHRQWRHRGARGALHPGRPRPGAALPAQPGPYHGAAHRRRDQRRDARRGGLRLRFAHRHRRPRRPLAVEFLSRIEHLRVAPDQVARVVIDEASAPSSWGRMCASPPSPSPRQT